MVEGLRLAVLGGLHLSVCGAPVAGFVSSKVPALLCYLAVTGRPHSRTELAGLLWGEMPDATALANLRQALANLRRLLAPYLLVTSRTVEFDRHAPYWLDVKTLQRQLEIHLPDTAPTRLAKADDFPQNQVLAEPPSQNAPDIAGLREAVELYRGEFLEGFHVRAAPAFEEWVLGQRERWRQTALQALDILSTRCAAENQLAEAIHFTTRRVTLDPWQEQAHRQLMELLARSGKREAALAQYETCRRSLAQELGVEPMAETTAFYERLRAAGRARPHNLPAPTTSFVGREAELAQIDRALADPTCRQLTILGPGGTGKTRLAWQAALQVCAQPGPAFADGVYLVSLAHVTSGEALIAEMARAVGLAFQPGTMPEIQLVNFLRGKDLLLILDGFEHLTAHARLLGELLQAAPRVRLWITSRHRLSLQGEWLLQLGGLSYPATAADADRPEAFPAGQLFAQRARQVRPDFALAVTGTEGLAVTRICQLVDGLPLGLELAAGWRQTLSCVEIVSEIEQSLDTLSVRQADRPARHHSIQAVLDHSWQLLSPTEQSVLQRTAVFCGGFSREPALQVARADLALLLALADKSLLRISAAGRYGLHPLVQHYAVKKLALRQTELGEVRALHGRYYAGLAQRCGLRLLGPDQEFALTEMDREIENVRAAWRWAAAERCVEALGKLLRGMGVYAYLRGLLMEGEAAMELAVAGLEAEGTAADQATTAVLGGALMFQGLYRGLLGKYTAASQVLEKSLACLRPAGETWETVMALSWLGMVTVSQGDYARGRQCAEEGLELARARGDGWLIGLALSSLGLCVRSQDQAAAAMYFREGYEAFREVGDWRQMAAPLLYLAEALRRAGQSAEARQHLESSLSFAREHHIQQLEAWTLWNLGEVAYASATYPEAQRYFQAGLAVARLVGDNQMILSCEAGWASAALRLGDEAEAQKHFHTAFRQAVETQAWPHITGLLIRRAEMLMERSQTEQARAVEWLTAIVRHPAMTQESRASAEALLNRLRSLLPPDTWAAAQARGLSRTIERLVEEMRSAAFNSGMSGT